MSQIPGLNSQQISHSEIFKNFIKNPHFLRFSCSKTLTNRQEVRNFFYSSLLLRSLSALEGGETLFLHRLTLLSPLSMKNSLSSSIKSHPSVFLAPQQQHWNYPSFSILRLFPMLSLAGKASTPSKQKCWIRGQSCHFYPKRTGDLPFATKKRVQYRRWQRKRWWVRCWTVHQCRREFNPFWWRIFRRGCSEKISSNKTSHISLFQHGSYGFEQNYWQHLPHQIFH